MITGPGPEEAPQLSLGEQGPREGILGDVHPSSVCRADGGPRVAIVTAVTREVGHGRTLGGASVESEVVQRQWSKQPEHVGEKF